MTDIEKRISELEKKVTGDNRTKEEIERERVLIEAAEKEVARRLKEIREEAVR